MKKQGKKKSKDKTILEYELIYEVIQEALAGAKYDNSAGNFDACVFCGGSVFVVVQRKTAPHQYIWWSICKWCMNSINSIFGSPKMFLEEFWVKELGPRPSIDTESVLKEIERIVQPKDDAR